MNVLTCTLFKNLVVTSKTSLKLSIEKIIKQNNYYLGDNEEQFMFVYYVYQKLINFE